MTVQKITEVTSMSNSSLVDYVRISPNSTNPRKNPISVITIHHMAGNLSVESCGAVFAPTSRQASSNYGIGTDGRVGLYVDEANRSWCSSNAANDNKAVTIEVANDDTTSGTWHVSDAALAKLIDLCTDICKRNGIAKLYFTGDKSGNLTMHKWFAATACPGPYLESKFPYIAAEVNKRLTGNAEETIPEKPVTPETPAEPAAPEADKIGKAVAVTLHQLSAGCTGPEVKTIQRIIYARGIDKNITVDGDFGPATKAAVIALQKKLFPSEPNEWDGIVGRKTWEAALTALK